MFQSICLILISFVALTAHAADLPAWAEDVGARSRPEATQVFLVNDHGAKADGATLATSAIQNAIDACNAAGGGVVAFKPGSYLTGSVFVKEGVNLRIDEDVTLLGSQDLKDYPDMFTRVAGIEMVWPAAMLNIIGQTNAAITGSGTVNAQGKPFWDSYWSMRREYEPKGLRWIVDYDCKRPRTLVVANSSDITIEGITLQQAGFWTVHILYSDHVTCDGLTIRNNIGGHGPSTDGIDIDSSSYILVQNSDIDCNDDNFCLKAGRDWDGLRVNRPTEYVVIRDCISRAGGGLITFGSETSGGIRHLLAYNLSAKGTGVGLRFKSASTRGGTVEDVHLRDIHMDGVRTAIEVSMNWNPSYSYSTLPDGYDIETVPEHWRTMLRKVEPAERGIPTFKNIRISNVSANDAGTAISASGTPQSIVRDFTIENLSIEAEKPGRIAHATGWKFENVSIKSPEGTRLDVRDSTDMDL